MSEQKQVSPLLDGFILGEPISDHDGVRCCPAIRENADDRYIVKIISVPASQKQLDALLLTGAYKDAAAATEYFRELAENVESEAALLQQLSKLEGFLPYDGWQVVPMDGGRLGYEVYLVSPYKLSLDKYLRRNHITHLAAVNLGLDLCAALAVCRRSGHLYVDLKPANIYIVNDKEYRIGDLGFVSMDSLKYSCLPSKYTSNYTAPELRDPMTTVNTTADIYSVGMILYQIYNNGQMPNVEEELPAPVNADYEMAEIILRACAQDPQVRWQDPSEMGQALVGYMQRNVINDIPIVPPMVEEPLVTEPVGEELPQDEADTHEELAFMSQLVDDETAPGADGQEEPQAGPVTDEGTDLLAQADDLIAHELPAPAVAPAPRDIPLPTAQPLEEEQEDEFAALLKQPEEDEDEDDYDEDDDYEYEDDDIDPETRAKRRRSVISTIATVLVLALVAFGGYFFYTNYYLMPIDNMEIQGDGTNLTVLVSTDVDESLLTVVCKDSYGNAFQSPVENGKAVVTGLNAGTLYQVSLETSGFHKLTGSTFGNYTTDANTEIIDFNAVTGNEDGSAVLSFAVTGPETQDWVIEYCGVGEEPQSVSFTGHTVTVSGLTVGNLYTFTLMPAPGSDLNLTGTTTLEFTASAIVLAENLYVSPIENNTVTISWNTPAGAVVSQWTVRCYAESGYDETITTSDNHATFQNLLDETAYTVEITADRMSQSVRSYVSASSVNVTGIEFYQDGDLHVSWTFNGSAPQGGWLVMYRVDGSENVEVIQTEEAEAAISPAIPGAVYDISLQAADGSTVFDGTAKYECEDVADFDAHNLDAANIQASLCPTPDKEGWTYKDIASDDYTSKYDIGQGISMVLYATKEFDFDEEAVELMYVIRNSDGDVITELVSIQDLIWSELWQEDRYAALNLPAVPEEAGSYSVSVYFDGAYVTTKIFTIK